MARTFANATTNYLNVGDAAAIDISGTAFSISCWVNVAALSARQGLIVKRGTLYQFELRIEATTGIVTFIIDDGTSVFNSATASAVTAGSWYHILAVKNGTGAGALYVYLNGTKGTATTSNVSVNASDGSLLFGCGGTAGSRSNALNGDLAEVAIWPTVALTDAEAVSLAKGFSPALIRPASLEGYWPIDGRGSPEIDRANGNGATVNGTSAAAHPRMLYPTRGQVGIRPLRSGAAGITQGADTVSAAGAVATNAAAALTQAADTLSAAGVVETTGTNGDAALTQAADTISAAGTVALAGDASITQAADTISAAGTLPIAADASITQAADTLAAAGTVAIVGDAALTQGADTLAAAGGAPALLGEAALTQAADTVSAAGVVATFGAADVIQGADTLAAAGAVTITGVASIAQGADTLSAAGALGVSFHPWPGQAFTIPDVVTTATARGASYTIPGVTVTATARGAHRFTIG